MKCFRCNHHGCSLLLFQYVVFMIFVAALSDFPTYNHPEYPNQRCYKCPPGYILDKHCTVGSLGTDAYTPRWGKCVACEPGEYMDNWNIDRRCYDRQTCSSTQKDYSKTSSLLSDAVCACNSSSIENKDGECVKGISKADHDTAIKKVFQDCDRMVSILMNTGKNTGPTSTPTTPVTYTVEYQWPVISTNKCGLSEGAIAGFVILGILLPMSVALNVYQFKCKCCRKDHQQNKDEDDKSRKNVPQDSVVSHEDETKKPKNIVKPPNVAQRKEIGPNGCNISLATSHGNPSFEHIADAKPEERQNIANTKQESEFESWEETDPLLLHGDRGDAQAQEKKKSLDKACHILEQSIRTEDLDKFTRDILGFTSDVCEDIKRRDKDIRSKVRIAFSQWERKNSKAATPRILVRGLRKHKWNKEADLIAAEYNVEKEEVEEDEEDLRLDDAIKICERMVERRDLGPFVRDCLGRNDIDRDNRSSTIREAFKGWVRENSSEATVQKLVKRLRDCEFTSVADSICMELNLQEPSKQDNEHRASAERAGAEEEQQNKIESSKEDTARSLNMNPSSEIVPVRKNVPDMEYDKSFTEGPQEDDKAVPVYNQQEQPPPEPVREMPQPTADATPFNGTTNRSRASSETSTPDNKSARPQNTSRTEPKGFFGTEPQKATSDYVDDDGTDKGDDENYGREIEEVDIVDEPNAGADGKAIEESDDDEEQSQA